MKKIIALCSVWAGITGIGGVKNADAAHFDPTTGRVTLDAVSVGTTDYYGVQVGIGQVLRYTTLPPVSTVDVFDPATGQLTIRSLTVGGVRYTNIVVTLQAVYGVTGAGMTAAANPVLPNDVLFSDQWHLRNTGQAGRTGVAGLAGDDLNAARAWNLATGKGIQIAILDDGLDIYHEDLRTVPGKSWDYRVNAYGDPSSGLGNHGTACGGLAAAIGNNGKGVVGVNWNVKLMPLKFLGSDGSGSTADAAEAIIYGVDNGAKVLSNSWGGGDASQVLQDAIQYAQDRGVLFIAASGNDSKNTDSSPNYPSNYAVPNVVSVASNDASDNLSSFSNFGRRTVDLSAPGSSIYSTRPLSRYQRLSGTSMATPHVAGAAALVMARYPSIASHQVIVRLLGGVDRKSAFIGKMVSGGRLNVFNAMSTNPLIALTTDWSNTTNTSGPYVVSTSVVDDQSVASVRLIYTLNGAGGDTLNMTPGTRDSYSANIPGQALNTTINYMVLATDNAGNRTLGPTYSFKISNEPDPGDGGGCCGQSAMAMGNLHGPAKYAVELPLNLAFFLLPLVLVRRWRKKK
ncbi:S8 family serine peptidase [candidate division KSB1 bacterium]|nr:S8 family serine peptidase [candidate division KSB1 bacterium]